VNRRGWALFAAMSLIWGVPYLLIKVADTAVSVPVVVFARVVVGSLLLLPIAIRRGRLRATVITYVNPAVAVALGAVVLGEPLTPLIVVSFALILAGSVLATRPTTNTMPADATPRSRVQPPRKSSLSRSVTAARLSGSTRVSMRYPKSRPGTLAKAPCGPRTIRPVSTS
jgi:drug/metabolite transporter (DMT)-like permease